MIESVFLTIMTLQNHHTPFVASYPILNKLEQKEELRRLEEINKQIDNKYLLKN